MSSLRRCDPRQWARSLLKVANSLGFAILVVTALSGQNPRPDAAVSKILEEKLAFPPPIQWKVQGIEVSLAALAWGPANSPEMISKGREPIGREKPEFFSDRPYALALCFRAKASEVRDMFLGSRLTRVKNVEGDLESPWILTPSGFAQFSGAPGTYDIQFQKTDTTQFCDFFPVSSEDKQFLFQVSDKQFLFQVSPAPGKPILSFRVIVKDNKFEVINAAPGPEATRQFKKDFTGTVGAESKVNWQLTASGAELSGTEQYARIGKTLWVQGAVDSLGNFELKEYYPKDQLTGIFDGKFSQNYGEMSGYFSKPDGSRLQPFEFKEVTSPAERR